VTRFERLAPTAVPLVSPDMNGSMGQEWPSSVNDYMYGDHAFHSPGRGCGASADSVSIATIGVPAALLALAASWLIWTTGALWRWMAVLGLVAGGLLVVGAAFPLGGARSGPVRHQVRQLHRPGPIRSRLPAEHAAGQGGGHAPSARRG
jgi:hypothetical protein